MLPPIITPIGESNAAERLQSPRVCGRPREPSTAELVQFPYLHSLPFDALLLLLLVLTIAQTREDAAVVVAPQP